MQEVTCPQCENSVTISPDATMCSICQTDLRSFISPDAAAAYFYGRASEMATSGHKQHALTEVNRGLTYADTSELRLLGAILSKQVGDYAQMRTHVAAIPVDDALRSEGEWLLRSHQSKKNGGAGAASALPATLQDDGSTAPAASTKRRSSWPLAVAVIILLALLFVWFFTGPLSNQNGDDVASASVTIEPASAMPPAEATSPPMDEGSTDGASADEDVTQPAQTDGSEESSPAPLPSPTLEPTPEPTEEPTATPSPTPDLGANGPVDMAAFFDSQGYVGLTTLDVEGELVDGELQLAGEVSSANEFDLVVELAERVEGAEGVVSEALTINPPFTYTISVGDNLWIISAFFYGDAEHMDDIYRQNREVLGSPEFLPVGAVIELPRFEDE